MEHDERANRIFCTVDLQHTRGGADAALESKAAHAASAADAALSKIRPCRFNGTADVRFLHVHAADVVERAVVALGDKAVDGSGAHADIGVLLQHVFAKCRIGRADAHRVGQEDGGLYRAELLHLQKADALAEAVDDGAGGHDLVAEQIAPVRENGRYARVDILCRVDQRGMADQHPGTSVMRSLAPHGHLEWRSRLST